MKKLAFAFIGMMISLTTMAHSIESIRDFNNGKVETTSATNIFSGCKVRLCKFINAQNNVTYGLQLDMTDRAYHVNQGDLLTIQFKDGNRMLLSNLWDTDAKISKHTYMETYNHSFTQFVPMYNRWTNTLFSMPVTRTFTEHVPVTQTTSFISLYYAITPDQLAQISQGNIKGITIVTDGSTINKKARPLGGAVAGMWDVIK